MYDLEEEEPNQISISGGRKRKGRKTMKKNLQAQRNMELDIQSISGGSKKRHICKCRTCGKSMNKRRSYK
jgi:hypothetical protein